MRQWIGTIIGAVLILGLCGVAGAYVLGHEQAKAQKNNTVTVTGSAKRIVTSDLAKWSAGFSRQASLGTLKEVLEQSAKDAERVRSFIEGYGISGDSIRFLPIQTDPVYEQLPGYGYTQNVVGYTVRQDVQVESKDIASIERLAIEAKKLIDQGVIPQYQRTEYFYTALADLRPELFAEATSDAKMRAEAIARGTQAIVGELRSAKTGLIQILQPNSLDVVDYGAYDTSTKEKEISATVTVSFALES